MTSILMLVSDFLTMQFLGLKRHRLTKQRAFSRTLGAASNVGMGYNRKETPFGLYPIFDRFRQKPKYFVQYFLSS